MAEKTRRDKAYEWHCSAATFATSRAIYDENFERIKEWVYARLAARSRPYAFEEVHVGAGCAPSRLSAILDELVDEGRVAVTHKPDGRHAWHVPKAPETKITAGDRERVSWAIGRLEEAGKELHAKSLQKLLGAVRGQ